MLQKVDLLDTFPNFRIIKYYLFSISITKVSILGYFLIFSSKQPTFYAAKDLTWGQCDQICQFFWTLGNFLKPLATINLPKSPTFLGNFCKSVKIYHFWATFIDIWQFFLVLLPVNKISRANLCYAFLQRWIFSNFLYRNCYPKPHESTVHRRMEPETTVYLDRLSLHYPPISDAFDNIENFFCIKQMIQLWHYWEIACSITINKIIFFIVIKST